MKNISLILLLALVSCTSENEIEPIQSSQFISVLGIAQDAGFPQAGCTKANCTQYWLGNEDKRLATSLGLIDKETGQSWMFEATPDFKDQLHILKEESDDAELSGIFLTHAHIGHYTGLIHLGHEVMGASDISVFAMPRMQSFLTENGPWSQLVNYENIKLESLASDSAIQLSDDLSVTPFLVPHRDEYSETVGYQIESHNKKVLFIPDINKWNVWDRSIVDEVAKVDFAFVDATFFDENELPDRDISQIPHPFVIESLEFFEKLPESERAKIIFIHFNHTNPLLLNSMERRQIENLGFKVAFEGMKIEL